MNHKASMKQETIDAAFSAALSASAPKAMYAGATLGGFGWLLSNEGMAFCGLMMAAIGTAVTVWVKLRQDRRDSADDRRKELEHQARMRQIERENQAEHPSW